MTRFDIYFLLFVLFQAFSMVNCVGTNEQSSEKNVQGQEKFKSLVQRAMEQKKKNDQQQQQPPSQ